MSEPTPAILVADDEPAIRVLTQQVLSEAGFEVITAADGIEALAHLKKRGDIRALISDLRIPRMGGVLLAAMAQARHPGLKVALMTAYSTKRFRLLELDQWQIWIKPFDIERLPNLAAGCVAQHRLFGSEI